MRLLKESSIYLFASVAEKALPFLLLPLLTRVLTTEEYGLIAMFVAVVMIFSVLGGAGLNGFIRVVYHKVGSNLFIKYIGNTLSLAIFLYSAIAVFTALFHDAFERVTGLSSSFLMLAWFMSLLTFAINLRLVIFQTSRNPNGFAKLQLLKPALDGILVLVFLVYLGGGGSERIYALVVSCIIAGVFALKLLHKDAMLRLSWNKSYAKRIMDFVLPVLPHSVILSLVFVVDKVILSSTVGLSMVGELAVALSLAMPMLVVADAVNRAFMPWSFEKLQKNELEEVVGASYFLLIVMFFVSIAYSVLLMNTFEYLVGNTFLNTLIPSLILVWSGWLKLAYYVVMKSLAFNEKLGCLSYVTFISAFTYFSLILTTIETITLIELSLYANCFHLMMVLGVFLLSQKFFPQPWGRFQPTLGVIREFKKMGLERLRCFYSK